MGSIQFFTRLQRVLSKLSYDCKWPVVAKISCSAIKMQYKQTDRRTESQAEKHIGQHWKKGTIITEQVITKAPSHLHRLLWQQCLVVFRISNKMHQSYCCTDIYFKNSINADHWNYTQAWFCQTFLLLKGSSSFPLLPKLLLIGSHLIIGAFSVLFL